MYKALAITTEYWRPGENYSRKIVKAVKRKAIDGDFLVISEKALSTAVGNIIDEETVKPSLSAKIIARHWMRIVWGCFLGYICHFQPKTIQRLREYPVEMGSRHKQVALQHAGLLQALMFGSEGGIDGSNLAFSFVSLPLKHMDTIANKIRMDLQAKLKLKVSVMVVDTDNTYSFRNFHFTPRPTPIKGINHFGGIISYVVGRMLGFKRRATPLTVVGCEIAAETALKIAEIANRVRGYGAGRTVWDMAEVFKVELSEVSWDMLEIVKHKPIVLVRNKR